MFYPPVRAIVHSALKTPILEYKNNFTSLVFPFRRGMTFDDNNKRKKQQHETMTFYERNMCKHDNINSDNKKPVLVYVLLIIKIRFDITSSLKPTNFVRATKAARNFKRIFVFETDYSTKIFDMLFGFSRDLNL